MDPGARAALAGAGVWPSCGCCCWWACRRCGVVHVLCVVGVVVSLVVACEVGWQSSVYWQVQGVGGGSRCSVQRRAGLGVWLVVAQVGVCSLCSKPVMSHGRGLLICLLGGDLLACSSLLVSFPARVRCFLCEELMAVVRASCVIELPAVVVQCGAVPCHSWLRAIDFSLGWLCTGFPAIPGRR